MFLTLSCIRIPPVSTEHRDNIYRGENLRLSGQFGAALATVRNALIEPGTIPTLSDPLLSDYIRKWRILTVTGTSLAQRKWLAKNARGILLQVRYIFSTYYHHPDVERKAPQYLQDNEKHEYDHYTEMIRDEGRYFMASFNIFEKRDFLENAIEAFQKATNSAVLNSPKGIALIELGQALKMSNELDDQPNPRLYREYFHPGFRLAEGTVIKEGNRDRLAWLLNHIIDASSHYLLIDQDAVDDWAKARDDFRRLFTPEESQKVQKQHSQKKLMRKLHQIVWKFTRLGLDSFPLSLEP